MRVLLVGPPGAGKGTQAQIFARRTGVPHVASGDMLRYAVRDKTPTGLRAKQYLMTGSLMPDDIVLDLFDEKFGKGGLEKGYVMEGFPRTAPQAKALAAKLGKEVERVIVMECSDDVIEDRLTGRRTCEACGTPYHLAHVPPRKPGVCDHDGSKLFERPDDVEEKIRQRLDLHATTISAILPYYDRQGLVRHVDAAPGPDAVAEAIRGAVLDLE